MELTPRQRSVAEPFCCGKTYRETAVEAGIAEGTVKPVLKQIARKYGTRDIARTVLCRLLGMSS